MTLCSHTMRGTVSAYLKRRLLVVISSMVSPVEQTTALLRLAVNQETDLPMGNPSSINSCSFSSLRYRGLAVVMLICALIPFGGRPHPRHCGTVYSYRESVTWVFWRVDAPARAPTGWRTCVLHTCVHKIPRQKLCCIFKEKVVRRASCCKM